MIGGVDGFELPEVISSKIAKLIERNDGYRDVYELFKAQGMTDREIYWNILNDFLDYELEGRCLD
ncbi:MULTISPECIES: hypothetical protein [Paenibacillus]|uniref:Uncharacterized protein n=1 Tax=Paenibacillus oralis TaxID=2490856 RepID=A0A3P3T7I2_9BACL|nr:MULTISPECIES: hypothetical protein [Paenibacillus]RRJ53996.1 hypothetical protein EHV15_36145 [Paenibacillus oralis]GBK66270.1 hypothetical protein PbDSM24746_62740 [Paenibacillus macerans]GBK72552.1 hypothetical protein PbJCM17693_62600 [Paenibacillus macerans]